MKYSEIKKIKLFRYPNCNIQLERFKRADSYFEKCSKCGYSNLIAFCTEYDVPIIKLEHQSK